MAATLGAIYEFKSSCWVAFQLGLNVIHWKVTAAAAVPESDATVGDAIDQKWAPNLLPLLANGVEYLGSSIKQLSPVAGLVITNNTRAGVGGDPDTVTSKQTCGIITKQTAFAGRANRGRIYIPFPGADQDNATGSPTNAYVANLQILANAMLPSINTHGGTTVTMIVYRKLNPALSNLVVNLRVNQKYATQRRRSDYGALNPATIQ